jgi:serine/threonine-protein kinase RsbW
MTSARVVKLRFPAKPEFLVLARLALVGIAQVQSVDQEVLADLKLAVTEACANVVRHAYQEHDPTPDVTVTIELSTSSISVRVDDTGIGFAPPTGDDPLDHNMLTRNADGMGLSIIRAVAEDVRISSGPDGRGTSVVLSKSLTPGRS